MKTKLSEPLISQIHYAAFVVVNGGALFVAKTTNIELSLIILASSLFFPFLVGAIQGVLSGTHRNEH